MNKPLLVLALLVLAAGGLYMNVPRGIRNNNPFNIKDSAIGWKGETGRNDDKTFEEFGNPVDGIRAGVRILLNYKRKHRINTVRALVNRFAPPVENDTGSYVRAVADAVGFPPDYEIDLEQHLLTLSRAIIKHENGFVPYSDRVIKMGIEAAYA